MKSCPLALLALVLTLVPFAAAAQTNRVLSLDGTGYMTAPHSPLLQPQNEITIEAWIYPRASPGNNSPHFVNKGDGASGGSSRAYEVGWSPELGFEFQVFLGSSTYAVLHVPWPSNRWVHVAVTYNSAARLVQFFTNGVVASSSVNNAAGNPLTGEFIRQTTLPLEFGRISQVGGTAARGYMDEIRIWNKARSAAEIQATLNSKLTGTEANLVGYWNFDDGTASDRTASGLNGSFINGATTVVEYFNAPVEIALAVEISFPTGAATTSYQVQYVTNALATNWTNVGSPVTGNGQTQSVFDRTRDGTGRIYRVVSY